MSPHRKGRPGKGEHPRTAPTVEEARRRLRRLTRVRFNRAQVLATVLTVLLGVALVAQARHNEEAGLRELRETELVALLDDASTRVDALQREIGELEDDRDRLRGEQGDEAAQEAARQRLESYQILAGTVPVHGPGITVYVADAGAVVTQTMMLDAIQELRDAGAEAIQIGAVRVVASSHVGLSADGFIVLDGQEIRSPYRMVAIGDSHTLAGAMAMPGGFTDSLRAAGAQVQVTEDSDLIIDAVHTPREASFARPAPAPAP